MKSTWYVVRVMPVLFTGGFFIHLIRVSRSLTGQTGGWETFLTRPVDAALALPMAFCALALVARRRQLFRSYDFSPRWRRICYWIFLGYVTLSIPGHALFLTTGNTAYFDVFPLWYSAIFILLSVVAMLFWILLPCAPNSSQTRDPIASLAPGANSQPQTRKGR